MISLLGPKVCSPKKVCCQKARILTDTIELTTHCCQREEMTLYSKLDSYE